MLNPEHHTNSKSNKPRPKKKPAKLRDLPPRKNALGGSGLLRNDPPLPIPPPGFIVNSGDGQADGKR